MVEHDTRTQSATLLTIVKYGDYQNRADTNKSTNKSTDKDTDKDTDESLLKNIKNDKEIKESAAPTLDESLALHEEKPPIPGAVKLPGGGWNYSPDIDWGDDD
jgi:hypothetical protein